MEKIVIQTLDIDHLVGNQKFWCPFYLFQGSKVIKGQLVAPPPCVFFSQMHTMEVANKAFDKIVLRSCKKAFGV